MTTKLLIFDLDGTLADTHKNIAYVVNLTLEKVGLQKLDDATIMSYVGDGSRTLLRKCFLHQKCSDHGLYKKALDILFPIYYDNVHKLTDLYDGVRETLEQLPYAKSVLTNKPGKMAYKLLGYLEIRDHFDHIIGGDDPELLKPNPHNLLKLMEKHQVVPENTYMIGDSPVDIQVAQNAGVHSIAVSFGFNPVESLQEADHIIEQFGDLLPIVKS